MTREGLVYGVRSALQAARKSKAPVAAPTYGCDPASRGGAWASKSCR
jgi:hypothetical protein